MRPRAWARSTCARARASRPSPTAGAAGVNDGPGVDLYSMSGHKLYAPKGVGALYVRKGTRLAPVSYGGHHERDRRPGTENVPGIAAFGAAAELAGRRMAEDAERLATLRDRLENAVLDHIPGTGVN